MNKLLKLTDIKRLLLFDNEGCLKCRHFFMKHHASDCPNDFPSAVGYKGLMNEDVNTACCKPSNMVVTVMESS
jgi:hypothetical protein